MKGGIVIKEIIQMKRENRIALFVLIVCAVLLGIDIFATYKTNEIMKQYNEVHVQQVETQTYKAVQDTEVITIDIVEIKRQEYVTKVEELKSIEDEQERFVAYKELYEEYLEWCDLPETIYDCYSEEEILLIQKVVETETYQCDFMSKVNVANVVLNRVKHESFPNTVTEVITAANQFAYGRNKISESTVLAVEYAFLNEDTTDGALFFHSNPKTDTFNGAQYVFSDDAIHHFYKK